MVTDLRICKKHWISVFLISNVIGSVAFAAGFQINETSSSIQGTALAGSAAEDNDVSAMFINPATLSTLRQNQAYFGGSIIYPSISYNQARATHTVNIPGSPPSSISAEVQGTTSQSNITSPALVPNGYVAWRINNRFVFGIGLTSPFGLTTSYHSDSVLRFAAQESSLQTVNLNPALSILINEKWAIGFGLQLQYGQASFSNFTGPYTGNPPIDALTSANFATKLDAYGWGIGYNLGLLFKPREGTRLGIGYRSALKQQLSGHGQQYTSPGPVVPAPSQSFLFNAQTSVNGTLNIPAVLVFSGAQDMDRWTVKGTAQLNFWDCFEKLSINMPNAFATNSTIPANWKNAWLVSAGADYRLNQDWTVRGGVAYDQTPTRDQYRDPRIPDTDRYWLTGGFSYKKNKHFSIDGAYEHIFAQSQTVNVTQASGTNATATVPLEVNQVSAKYKSSVDIISLALRYSFG